MGFACIGQNDTDFHCNIHGWGILIDLGMQYGWKPAGTQPPPDYKGKWDGSYGLNMGQVVTAEDAKAWAMAVKQHQTKPNDFYTASRLQEFCDMCLEGSFQIY